MSSIIALVPARTGSQRVSDKNIRELGGHPLLAYSVVTALESGLFDRVVCSAETEQIAAIARHYGTETIVQRPSTPVSRDIEWVNDAVQELGLRRGDAFAILRPTSPFRRPETLQRAWAQFHQAHPPVDSLRAVRLCREHPGKMWVLPAHALQRPLQAPPNVMVPFVRPGPGDGFTRAWPTRTHPWHSMPSQALPIVHVQTSSLEIAWAHVVLDHGTIAGQKVMAFVMAGLEGFAIDTLEDWDYAVRHAEGLPSIPAARRYEAVA